MRKNEIREILHRLDMERKKFLGPKLQVLGLTVGEGQARALRTLLEEGPMTQKQLADLCMRDAATMSRNIDRLEKAGLLKRENNPGCRRSYLICLTEEGKEKAKQVQKIFRELDERIWGDIPEKEMEQLYETLLRIERNLE
ncbi:MAG TPA: MarR family transcriptional regulator [Candidatus Merdisoma faecalis]|nr:MarR family transcriptional regulator [Candidatus Merdisoma faecalis]